MTIAEVINEIQSTPKYYLGIMNQSTASRMIKRIKLGTCSVKSRDSFLLKFGYYSSDEFTQHKSYTK